MNNDDDMSVFEMMSPTVAWMHLQILFVFCCNNSIWFCSVFVRFFRLFYLQAWSQQSRLSYMQLMKKTTVGNECLLQLVTALFEVYCTCKCAFLCTLAEIMENRWEETQPGKEVLFSSLRHSHAVRRETTPHTPPDSLHHCGLLHQLYESMCKWGLRYCTVTE